MKESINSAQQNKDNHYVPRMYLKNWSTDGSTVWMYRRLVSHKNVEWWKKQSIDNTAYLSHLYSHLEHGGTTDEFEKWLSQDVETPAKASIDKSVAGLTLNDDEMLALLRFTMAQLVRTPAYYVRHHKNWARDLPQVMTSAMEETYKKILSAIERGEPLSPSPKAFEDKLMPIKLSYETAVGNDNMSYVKAETVVSRAMWLSHIKRMVTVNV